MIRAVRGTQRKPEEAEEPEEEKTGKEAPEEERARNWFVALKHEDIMRACLRPVPPAWNVVTKKVIGCTMEVHTQLGPGMLEKIYEAAMLYELRRRSLRVQSQVLVRVKYKDIVLPEQRIDIVVEDLLVLELKARDGVSDADLAQMVSYQRCADVPLGLLINFNEMHLRDGIYRRLNPRASAFHTQQVELVEWEGVQV